MHWSGRLEKGKKKKIHKHTSSSTWAKKCGLACSFAWGSLHCTVTPSFLTEVWIVLMPDGGESQRGVCRGKDRGGREGVIRSPVSKSWIKRKQYRIKTSSFVLARPHTDEHTDLYMIREVNQELNSEWQDQQGWLWQPGLKCFFAVQKYWDPTSAYTHSSFVATGTDEWKSVLHLGGCG